MPSPQRPNPTFFSATYRQCTDMFSYSPSCISVAGIRRKWSIFWRVYILTRRNVEGIGENDGFTNGNFSVVWSGSEKTNTLLWMLWRKLRFSHPGVKNLSLDYLKSSIESASIFWPADSPVSSDAVRIFRCVPGCRRSVPDWPYSEANFTKPKTL